MDEVKELMRRVRCRDELIDMMLGYMSEKEKSELIGDLFVIVFEWNEESRERGLKELKEKIDELKK